MEKQAALEKEMSDVRRRLADVAARPDVQRAVAFLRDEDEATIQTQIRITETPAPPFGEAPRGRVLATLFEASGLTDVRTDAVGNVLGTLPGANGAAQPLVVSAHLDTVFPDGTDVSVTRRGALLEGPGISDDGRGLAAMVALARAFQASGVRTRAPLLFVGTVGEEGLGDLRGVKALFDTSGAGHGAAGFISLDGAGIERIVTRGLGSRRFRVTVVGPGGHSWVDWGTPNPAHALMELGARLTALQLPSTPKTTLTVARLGGGKSINAIPQSVWLEMDARSSDGPTLTTLVERITRLLESEAARHPGLTFDVETIGDRPGGETAPSTLLVRAAVAATELLGYEATTTVSSTDANVPMTRGIPAITMGCGGDAGKAHTTEEWYRNTGGPEGITRALYTVLVSAGMDGAAATGPTEAAGSTEAAGPTEEAGPAETTGPTGDI